MLSILVFKQACCHIYSDGDKPCQEKCPKGKNWETNDKQKHFARPHFQSAGTGKLAPKIDIFQRIRTFSPVFPQALLTFELFRASGEAHFSCSYLSAFWPPTSLLAHQSKFLWKISSLNFGLFSARWMAFRGRFAGEKNVCFPCKSWLHENGILVKLVIYQSIFEDVFPRKVSRC